MAMADVKANSAGHASEDSHHQLIYNIAVYLVRMCVCIGVADTSEFFGQCKLKMSAGLYSAAQLCALFVLTFLLMFQPGNTQSGEIDTSGMFSGFINKKN